MELEHANGSVQGICSGAIGMLALLIAFIGYTGFNTKGSSTPWQFGDLFHLALALISAITLSIVPWAATRPQPIAKVGRSVEQARRLFLSGSICAVLAMTVFVIRDFLGNHV